ncbi:uncharacterized protein LOC142976324 [Anticarsia gemmatalis]|uniref:uncharacterized protein LOC142976324 n=1 Tax=Anticarsia gemmatalis TaxID=129554 RepID=UPI003F76A89D
MGHAVLCLALAARALQPPDLLAHALPLPPALAERWAAFLDQQLRPLLQQHDTPLGGYYPSENFYEVEIMPDTLAANYDYNDMATAGTIEELTDDINADDANELCGAVGSSAETPDFIADGLGIDDNDKLSVAKNNFLELASQRFDDDMWEDSGDADADVVRDVLDQHSPWESGDSSGVAGAGDTWGAAGGYWRGADNAPVAEGWAHFGHAPDTDTTADAADDTARDPNATSELESNLRTMRLEGGMSDKSMDEASSVELANNLLTAMSAMSADAIANIVNANLPAAALDEPAPADSSEHR